MADTEQDKGGTEEEATEETGAKSEELGDGGKKALDAERKSRRMAEKRMKELEAKVKEAEDADKTELERLQDKAAQAEKRAEAADAKATRFEIAAAKGLSLAQARRLVGSTKEDLEDDADAMRAELGLDKEETSEEKKDDGGTREDLRSGASNPEDQEPDPGKLADSILSSGW